MTCYCRSTGVRELKEMTRDGARDEGAASGYEWLHKTMKRATTMFKIFHHFIDIKTIYTN